MASEVAIEAARQIRKGFNVLPITEGLDAAVDITEDVATIIDAAISADRASIQSRKVKETNGNSADKG